MCLLTSAVCHLFGCCAAHVAAVLWRFDYAGIAVLIVASFFPPVYYGEWAGLQTCRFGFQSGLQFAFACWHLAGWTEADAGRGRPGGLLVSQAAGPASAA